MRGRYAPSPTGDLHLGNARTALVAWLAARAAGSSFVVRVEDLDRARVVAGAEERILADLRWLGLDWDEGPDVGGLFGPYRQSERLPLYQEALDRLTERGRVYACTCSRADIQRAASAPHADEEGPRYPGTCRERVRTDPGRPPSGRASSRFGAEPDPLVCQDEVQGIVEVLPPRTVDDFVLQRADGVFAYQLAVVVDDAAMQIEEVVRAADLLSSTPRQLALYRALDLSPPLFAHVPLVLGPEGQRLAKRARPPSLRDLAKRGLSPEEVVGALAASVGLLKAPAPIAARALVNDFTWAAVARTPAVTKVQDGDLVLRPLAEEAP